MKSASRSFSLPIALVMSLVSIAVLAQQTKPAVVNKQVDGKINQLQLVSDSLNSTNQHQERQKATLLKKEVLTEVKTAKETPKTILHAEQKEIVGVGKGLKSDLQQTKTGVTKSPVTGQTIKTEKAQLVSKGKKEAAQLKSTLDTLRHPKLKRKVKTAIHTEKENVKETFTSYKNGFKVSRFSEMKIDTGEVPLEKEGLLKRGNQFIKSNTSGTDLPSSFPGRLSNFKEEQFLKSPVPGGTLPKSLSGEVGKIENGEKKIESIKNGKVSEVQLKDGVRNLTKKIETSDNNKLSKASEAVDKVINTSDKDIFAKGKVELSDVKKVYSEKYIKKITDSLGLQKADSVLKIAAPLLKQEVSKDELLQTINSSMGNKTKMEGVGFNTKDETLNLKDADKFNAVPGQFSGGDLSKLKLPQGVLQELPPLRGDLVDKKYVHIIDSMKRVNLKAQNLKMNENELTGKLKTIIVKEKPRFFDKSYLELILGFYQSNSFTVFQASPSFAYHFTDHLSTGIGPSILVKLEEKKKLNTLLGFRYYAKVELYKRRVYLQVEDNVTPSALNRETLQTSVHTVLAGGGVLLPLSKTLALNPCLLYRINTDHTSASGQTSPWVFRLGISSLKLKK